MALPGKDNEYDEGLSTNIVSINMHITSAFKYVEGYTSSRRGTFPPLGRGASRGGNPNTRDDATLPFFIGMMGDLYKEQVSAVYAVS